MNLIDRLERLGRLILWLCLSAFLVMIPIGLHAQAKQTALAAETAHVDAERLRLEAAKQRADGVKEKDADRGPISIRSVGLFLTAHQSETGLVWLTNASPRAGVVCLQGAITNARTGQVARSIPSCLQVAPFASNVTVKLMFAGGEVNDACPAPGSCALKVEDAPLRAASPG